MNRIGHVALSIFWLFFGWTAANAELADVIEKVKPSIVAVGTYKKTQSPPFAFRGTGFVIGNGNLIATNSHVLPMASSADDPELTVLIRGRGSEGSLRKATLLRRSSGHDLAVIRIDGPPLPFLKLGNSSSVREGQKIAFTGFPIGGALGYSPVSHTGIVSAITPIGIPSGNSTQLNSQLIQRLKQGAFNILQLDATAFPGNSGSPVYDADTAEVLGIINQVLIKGAKESAISQPSGITYAIPVDFLREIASNESN